MNKIAIIVGVLVLVALVAMGFVISGQNKQIEKLTATVDQAQNPVQMPYAARSRTIKDLARLAEIPRMEAFYEFEEMGFAYEEGDLANEKEFQYVELNGPGSSHITVFWGRTSRSDHYFSIQVFDKDTYSERKKPGKSAIKAIDMICGNLITAETIDSFEKEKYINVPGMDSTWFYGIDLTGHFRVKKIYETVGS